MLSMNEAVEVLFAERINIEVILTSDDEGYLFYNFRARPWKNSVNDGRMLLVGAPTLDECMILLADALLSSAWMPLAWGARLHEISGTGQQAVKPTPKLRTAAAEETAEPRYGVKEYPYTNR